LKNLPGWFIEKHRASLGETSRRKARTGDMQPSKDRVRSLDTRDASKHKQLLRTDKMLVVGVES
jgi:hypothetical protein